MIPRYEDRAVSAIWSRERQLRGWAQVELAWMSRLSETAWMDARRAAVPTPEQVDRREAEVHHEFVAFLECWTERFESDEAARWVHWSLTSSDVIDTATALQLVETHSYLCDLAAELQHQLQTVREQVGQMVQVGRTHGQWAQPRRADTPLAVLADMLGRQIARTRRAGVDLEEGDLSGATGGRDLLEEPKVNAALRQLGLRRAPSSTQILPRDSWVHWAQCVTGLVTICEAIAEYYWFLAQSEIGEVEVVNGAGSSAMPHKRGNPHRAENVRGLARLARGLVSTLDESIVQRGDRDLAHSSVERVVLPDLAHLAATAMTRTVGILTHYQHAPEMIEANLVSALHDRADSAMQLSELVAAGMPRAEAIRKIR